MSNTDDKIKCGKCLVFRDPTHYHQIIKRQDHDIDSDENGFSYYVRQTKLCLHCRNYLKDRLKKENKNKNKNS